MENVILVPTSNYAAGRAVLRVFDDLVAANAIELRAAALMERAPYGRWTLPSEDDSASHRGTLTSGAIGALIGFLGGPGGLLLGGAARLRASSSAEAGDGPEPETILHALERLVPPGAMAAVGEVVETTCTAIDDALAALGMTAWRMTGAEAEAQLHVALGHDVTMPGPQQ
ncbi:MAG: hypothetical protein AB1679_16145 [Actinomycetota bacterium]